MQYFTAVYSGLKCCPFLLAATGNRVLPRHFINSTQFTAACKNSPSARCVPATNKVNKNVDIFMKPIILQKHSALICDVFVSTYLCLWFLSLSFFYMPFSLSYWFCFAPKCFVFVYIYFCVVFVVWCWLCKWFLRC
jgi:hypothetical protein